MESFLDPKEVLNKIELKKDMIAVDFGSGSGGWAIPLAKKLEKGKVYAIDILTEPLSALKSKANSERVFNIETIQADVEKGVRILENFCDLVLMTNLLFEIEQKEGVFKEAKRVLKKGGKILVVDWLPEAPLGPKSGRISAEEVKKIAKETDFELEKEFPAGSYHWALVFVKT